MGLVDVLARNGLSSSVMEELDNTPSVCDNCCVAFIMWSHVDMN